MTLQESSFLISFWQTASKAFEIPDKSFILTSGAQQELKLPRSLKSEDTSL